MHARPLQVADIIKWLVEEAHQEAAVTQLNNRKPKPLKKVRLAWGAGACRVRPRWCLCPFSSLNLGSSAWQAEFHRVPMWAPATSIPPTPLSLFISLSTLTHTLTHTITHTLPHRTGRPWPTHTLTSHTPSHTPHTGLGGPGPEGAQRISREMRVSTVGRAARALLHRQRRRPTSSSAARAAAECACMGGHQIVHGGLGPSPEPGGPPAPRPVACALCAG